MPKPICDFPGLELLIKDVQVQLQKIKVPVIFQRVVVQGFCFNVLEISAFYLKVRPHVCKQMRYDRIAK